MNVFLQGMRRSGTTIVFDILWGDRAFDCYYEPFAEGKKKVLGGGSGVRNKVDYFENIRNIRSAFIKCHPEVFDIKAFNFGAPNYPELELEKRMPLYCKTYIRSIISKSENTAIKFTRMYNKIETLYDIDPKAKFVHIVRNPKAVTASYLFGKNQVNKQFYPDQDSFFGKKSQRSTWNYRRFTDCLLKLPENTHLKDIPDFKRILLLWKYTFKQTYSTAKDLFGVNYLLLRNEDLRTEPIETVKRVYDFLEFPLKSEVLDWAKENIIPVKKLYANENPEWKKSFSEIGMLEEIELSGYNLLI